VTTELRIPRIVREAHLRAKNAGDVRSSEDAVGWLLATLAGALPRGGRVLEIGTGCGVGLAWIVTGISGRDDVSVVSVEADAHAFQVTRDYMWPECVSILNEDILPLYDRLGQFDLVFADAAAGKWEGLDKTIQAMAPGGFLLLDDMAPDRWRLANERAANEHVLSVLCADSRLVCTELPVSTGIIVCARKREP